MLPIPCKAVCSDAYHLMLCVQATGLLIELGSNVNLVTPNGNCALSEAVSSSTRGVAAGGVAAGRVLCQGSWYQGMRARGHECNSVSGYDGTRAWHEAVRAQGHEPRWHEGVWHVHRHLAPA